MIALTAMRNFATGLRRGNGVRVRQGLERWVMLCVIPAIALTVAARQLYLSTTDDLSTWKGAAWACSRGPRRLPATSKSILSFQMAAAIRCYGLPRNKKSSRRRFSIIRANAICGALANSIKATTWWASTTRVPLNVFDGDGQKVRDGTEQLYDLYAAHPRTASEPAGFGVEIEYWKATYDLKTREYVGALVRTYKLED